MFVKSILILEIVWSIPGSLSIYLSSGLQSDGCNPTVYRVLDDTRRSPSFHPQDQDDLLCDDLLPPGWYRLMAQGKSGFLPSSCPGAGVCGTSAPVWMETKIPDNLTQIESSACVSWPFRGSSPDCCLFTIPVIVRNCGSFLSYYLQPTQACSVAYCIDTDKGPTESSQNGVRQDWKSIGFKMVEERKSNEQNDDIPIKQSKEKNIELKGGKKHKKSKKERRREKDEKKIRQEGKPRIQLNLENQQVRFECSLNFKAKEQIAIWSRIENGGVELLDLSVEELEDGISIFSPGILIQPGDKLVCEVDGIRSEPYPTGLSIQEQNLNLREDGGVVNLDIVQHTPIICSSKPCSAQLIIQTRNSFVGVRPSDILVSRCSIPLREISECDVQGCGNHSLQVSAALDLITDGDTTSFLDFAVVSRSLTNWDNYFFPSVQVKVNDIPTSMCHVFTDPHMISLDGARFDLYTTGTFLLYKSLDENFEVHIRLWECSRTGMSMVSCVCGMVVREGGDMLTLDMCGDEGRDSLPRLSMHSIPGARIRTRVLESRKGKVLTFEFESGRRLRIHLEYWGLSLSLRVHGADHGYSRGLCGIFDGDKTNDFHDKEGRILDVRMNYGQVNKFAEEWRLEPGSSMFDKTPVVGDLKEKPRLCGCSEQMRIVTQDVSGIKGELESPCSSSKPPRVNQLLQFIDISPSVSGDPLQGVDGFIKTNQWFDYMNDQPSYPNLNHRTKQVLGEGFDLYYSIPTRRTRRSSSNHLYNALPESSYIFPGDYNGDAGEPVIPTYPTRSGLTEENVYKLCNQVIINSTMSKECGKYIKNIIDVLDMCVLDVSLMDDTMWTSYTLPLLENICEEETLNQQLTWDMDLMGNLIPPRRIKDGINCPNFCSGKGYCNGKECVCDPGYTSFDCSHFSDFHTETVLPPYLYMAGNYSICDLQRDDCSRIRVLGQDFLQGPGLACSLRELGVPESESVKKKSKAEFISDKSINCNLDGKVYKGEEGKIFEIRVTNDGREMSNEIFISVFDSTCDECPEGRMPQHPTVCKRKSSVCQGKDGCYESDSVHPLKPCLLCTNGEWKTLETRIFGEKNISLKILAGEILTYKMNILDSVAQFKVLNGPTGLKIKDGEIHWSSSEESTGEVAELIQIVGETECEVQEILLLRVQVEPCPCKNGGMCLRSRNGTVCECEKGFKGEDCSEPDTSCTPNPCFYGTCEIRENRIQCVCDQGFKGELCEDEISPCQPSPCYPGVDCLELGDGYECGLCPEPLVGDGMSCEPPGLCNPNPCYPGVICTPSNWHFSCAPCPPGMWGNGVNCFKNNSQDKICSGLNDNCKPSLCNSSNPDLCLNDNSLPTDSTFTPKRPMEPEKPLGRVEIAEKAPGRDKTMVKTTNRNGVSEKTSRLAEIQEETLKLSGVLEKPQEHVGISEVVSGHSLLDKTSGFTAKSPDPCKPNPCFTNVSCNVDSGYVICGNCPAGYKGDGFQCTRDFCHPNPCFDNVTCHSRTTGFLCDPCPDGFIGNGINCRDLCSDISCHPGVSCLILDGSPVCGKCPEDMIGDGSSCETDACKSNPCYHSVDCIHRNGTYECGPCPRGYLGDGESCFRNPCLSKPCHRGVECRVQKSGEFSCGPCPQGLVGDGKVCSLPACLSRPCYPGVECIDEMDGEYRCGECPENLVGDGRECTPDYCAKENPCFSGVSCYNMPGKAKCGNCPPGYVGNGIKCTPSDDPCSTNPCYPGVSCVNLWMGRSAGFVCGSCPDSLIGDGIHCRRTDSCSPNPCYPGVACSPLDTGEYKCGGCPNGMLGDGIFCFGAEDEIDNCLSNPCYPGVACKSTQDGFECGVCPQGMEGNGEQCQDIDDCSPNPCYTGVSCTDIPAPKRGYSCGSCPPPSIGDGTLCIIPRSISCPDTVRCYPGVSCLQGVGGDISCGSCPKGMEGDGTLCRRKCFPTCNAHQRCSEQTCLDPPSEDISNLTLSPPAGSSDQALVVPGEASQSTQPSSHSFLAFKTPKCKKKCRNGGTCGGRNRCLCPPGWRGRWCNKPRCAGGCKNNGKCVAPNQCSCKPGFSGSNCNRECALLCENGGSCRKNGKCRCQPGYFGKTCSKHVNNTPDINSEINNPATRASKINKVKLIQQYLSSAQK